MEDVLTTKQVADRLGKTEGWIRQLCISGVLEAQKHGRSWAISESALERYQTEQAFREEPHRNGN